MSVTPIIMGALFAGVGGFELGLEVALAEAGIPVRVAWQVEIDPDCRAVLSKHWPHADRRLGDVTRALAGKPRRIAPGVEVLRARRSTLVPVHVLAFGFPCQDVSSAGRGKGLDGERSGLWFAARDIVEELRPPVVVVENVASGRKRWLCRVRSDLHALGYRTVAFQLGVWELGGPHRRERIFVVAVAGDGPGGAVAYADGPRNARRAEDAPRHDSRGHHAGWSQDSSRAADRGPVAQPERLGLQRSADARAGGSDPGAERDPHDTGRPGGLLCAAGGGAVADADDGQRHERQGQVRPPDVGPVAGWGELWTGGRGEALADPASGREAATEQRRQVRSVVACCAPADAGSGGQRGPGRAEPGSARAERAVADARSRGQPSGDRAQGRQPEPHRGCARGDACGDRREGEWVGAPLDEERTPRGHDADRCGGEELADADARRSEGCDAGSERAGGDAAQRSRALAAVAAAGRCDRAGAAALGDASGPRRSRSDGEGLRHEGQGAASQPSALSDADGERRGGGTGASVERGGSAEPAHGREVGDSAGAGGERADCQEQGQQPSTAGSTPSAWGLGAESCVGRSLDGVPSWMDGAPARVLPGRWPAGRGQAQEEWEPPRTVAGKHPGRRRRLRQLGNAVSPPQSAEVGRRFVVPALVSLGLVEMFYDAW